MRDDLFLNNADCEEKPDAVFLIYVQENLVGSGRVGLG
jgi:hypothetical protein